MASVVPFRGLRYSTSRLPDLDPVVAPPYDVISADMASELRARHANNIVHLDLPEGEGEEKYSKAAHLMARWCDEAVLVRDERPALYVCSERYALRGMPEKLRWGFVSMLRIEEEDAGLILPHEATMIPPRNDRAELSAATRAQLSPIFMFYSDPSGKVSGAIEAQAARPAERWARDASGVEVSLWRVTAAEVVRTICEGLEGRKVWIADGHHRYAAARDVRERLRALDPGAGSGPRSYDYVMTYLSDVDSPGLTILPYHRVVRGLGAFDAAALERRVSDHFDVKHFSFEGLDHRAEQIRRRLHEVADRGRLAFALYTGGAGFVLLLLKEGHGSVEPFASLPEPLRNADVAVLQTGILEPALGLSLEGQPAADRVRYTADVDQAMSWVDAGEAKAAFLMNATRKQHLMSVAEAGLRMPAKSTYFYPKVLTGLVLSPLEPFEEVHRPSDLIAAGNRGEG